MVEILDAAYKNTSTDVRLILSTKSGLVEVVEIVEVFYYIYRRALVIVR